MKLFDNESCNSFERKKSNVLVPAKFTSPHKSQKIVNILGNSTIWTKVFTVLDVGFSVTLLIFIPKNLIWLEIWYKKELLSAVSAKLLFYLFHVTLMEINNICPLALKWEFVLSLLIISVIRFGNGWWLNSCVIACSRVLHENYWMRINMKH